MPFSKTKEHHTDEYWKNHFTFFLKPLIERNPQLEAIRSEPLRGDIASQIITDLTNDQIIVADLTDHNPNVFWELGVRQSFKHGTITIAETGTTIPFHFNQKGILFYNGEHLNNEVFEKQFGDALNNCIEHPEQPDSPVLVAIGGRGTLYGMLHHEENLRRITAVINELDYNNERIKAILECIKTNESNRLNGKKDETEMVLLSFRTIAAENLSVNRYLDYDEDFYRLLGTYHSYLDYLREQQSQWFIIGTDESIEKIFKEASDRVFIISEGLRKDLEIIK